MKRGSRKRHVHIIPIILVLLAVALAGYITGGGGTGAIVYRDAGYGYGGYGGGYYGDFFDWFNFVEIYYQYTSFIDALLFLIIFLGLGKATLFSHFKHGGKPLYIGVGIFLALSLLVWEEQSGIYLTMVFGPYVGIILAILIVIVLFNFARQAGMHAVFALWLILVLLFFLVFKVQDPLSSGNLLRQWFQGILSEDTLLTLIGLLYGFSRISVVALPAIYLIYLAQRKRKEKRFRLH